MIIKEAAEYLVAVTGQEITAKQLTDQLQSKFPEQSFNINSEVPESFIEEIEKLATRVQDSKSSSNSNTQATAGGLGMTTSANSSEAIVNAKSAVLGITQCIQQVLMDEEVVVAINRGFNDALTVLQAYESGRKQVLEAHVGSRMTALEEETNSLISEREALLMQRDEEERDRLGKWSVTRHNSRTRLQRTQQDIADLLKLF
ncbi:hypothetical protein NIES2109_22640 [Nostoc sp. HK-01]|nr:hypothetical protein NIES2109_22640 [Nostoc sp. HK-01]